MQTYTRRPAAWLSARRGVGVGCTGVRHLSENQNAADILTHLGAISEAELPILVDAWNKVPKADFLAAMRLAFGDSVGEFREGEYPFSQAAFERFGPAEVAATLARITTIFGSDVAAKLEAWRSRNFPHFRREFLRYGCAADPTVRDRTGISIANPPQQIHSMTRNAPFVGDLYSTDMILAAVQRAGHAILAGEAYLDFGCSSGPVVRNMAAAFQQSRWLACDPVQDSVSWASRAFPSISFICNAQSPPLAIADGSLAGAYAISIWSHFSERAALAWFDEMWRLVKPGGFLCFTAHGLRSIYNYLEKGMLPLNVMTRALTTMIYSGHAFQPVWPSFSPQANFLDTTDWGNAYFTSGWVESRLVGKWRVSMLRTGLNQSNQDVYVLTRT